MKKVIQILLCCGLILMGLPVLAQSRPAVSDTSRSLQRERVRVGRQVDSLKKQVALVQDSLVRASVKDALQARLDRLRMQIDSTMGVQRQLEERLKAKRDL
jgi:hypothetical protein